MCGAILRPFNSISCQWESRNDMYVLDPVYSRKDCRLQLIPGTATFNLPSYRNSIASRLGLADIIMFIVYNVITHITSNTCWLLPLLLCITSQLVITNWLLVISSWFSLLRFDFSLLRVGCSLLRYGFSLFRVCFSLLRVGFPLIRVGFS